MLWLCVRLRQVWASPRSFALSGKQRVDQRVLGNGVAHGLAEAIALAAMGKPLRPASTVSAARPAAGHRPG